MYIYVVECIEYAGRKSTRRSSKTMTNETALQKKFRWTIKHKDTMKGIVFTEFLEMVEGKFGYEVVDEIITATNLSTDGVYTSVGTYPHSEIVGLLMNLSDKVKVDPALLLKEFGKYLFDTFLRNYPQFFTSVDNVFDFLHSIDAHIHVEVLKLYPDATLPKFETKEDGDGNMTMVYSSERKMSALAEGLMEKSIAYYGESYTIAVENITEDGKQVKFTISKA